VVGNNGVLQNHIRSLLQALSGIMVSTLSLGIEQEIMLWTFEHFIFHFNINLIFTTNLLFMKEYTISIGKINAIALAMIAPIAILLGIPFGLIHGFSWFTFKNLSFGQLIGGSVFIILLFLVGAALHEFLHGFTWSLFTKKGWKAISFGIKWEYLTPYCHCDEPLKKIHFMLGAIMPCLVLGLVPVVFSYFTGSFRVWFFGFFFTVAAGGDLIAIWMLRKISWKSMILDHPSEVGFIVKE
jgi:hypothetical protein